MLRRIAAIALLTLLAGSSCGNTKLTEFPWQGAVGSGSRAITVEFGLDPCRDFDHAEVGYGLRAVTVTLFATNTARRCSGLSFVRAITVPLHEPLAGRRIVDGARA